MTALMSTLKQAGLGELACQFAHFIARKEQSNDEQVALTAALLTESIAQGHVCLNLAQPGLIEHSLKQRLPETLAAWRDKLSQSNVVGVPGDYKPLILTSNNLLYLYRHWQQEQQVAAAIRERMQPLEIADLDALQQTLSQWQNPVDGIDWQKVAVLMALSRQFSVISGGPGTGKTTVVLKILQCLLQQNNQLRVALAAPTGKAAARLQQAISEHATDNIEAKTIHRLLGISTDNERGRFHSQRKLPVDVLIVDEASMIDISLMAKLLQALPATSRLILLGDSQQLASVESGAVLANLCEADVSFSDEFAAMSKTITGITLPASTQSAMCDSVVKLEHSYRFTQSSVIGQLARAIQAADIGNMMAALQSSAEPVWFGVDTAAIQSSLVTGFQAYLDAVEQATDPVSCLQDFETFRVLCALRQGPQSVASVNQLMERYLQSRGWRTNQAFYHGRPIMVTHNDYRQRLFNGDTGLILRDENGVLRGCFLVDDMVRWIPLNRLPAHETAFAMTVHKSQGSEFDNVCLLLPEQDSPLLNRELLYTAVTRARKQVSVLATEERLRSAIQRSHQRETGLAELLTD